MRTLVVLASYNEAGNIVEMVSAVLAISGELDVCVVDDSSPDGTAGRLEQARRGTFGWQERVHLIVRDKKDGRGGAVRRGMEWGLSAGRYDAFVEMDCDFSHAPDAIPTGLSLLREGHEVVIGARYPNGTIVGWPRSRRVFSFFANTLARVLIDTSITDYTNGFRFYSTAAVGQLLAQTQKHSGYIYLSESLSHLLLTGCRVASFPIVFKNRERGQSNTTAKEIRSALVGILSIGLRHRFAQVRRR